MTLEELKAKNPDLFQQAMEQARQESAKTAGEEALKAALEAAQAEKNAIEDRLIALEHQNAEKARRESIRTEIVAAIEGTELPADVLDLAVECGCEMKESAKMKELMSKISPLLREVPDSEDGEEVEIVSGKESVDDDEPAVLESAKSTYTPGKKSTRRYDLLSAIGKKN